jgi:hypothetical protein
VITQCIRFALVQSSKESCDRSCTSIETVRLTASLSTLLLSNIEHRRSIRPSTFLTCFLLVYSLGDFSNLILYSLTDYGNGLSYSSAVLHNLVTVILFAVECGSKQRYLKPQYCGFSAEFCAGFFDRLIFWWIIRTLFKGSAISIVNPPELTEEFAPDKLRRRMLRCLHQIGPSILGLIDVVIPLTKAA